MTKLLDLDKQCSQSVFASVLGVNQSTVSRMIDSGVIGEGATLGEWIRGYFAHIREQAAGRLGSEVGGLDLVQERAALAREQRIAQKMKNAVARGEYAPIGLLADVLGKASSAVVDRFDQLEGALRKAAPDVSDDVLAVVLGVTATARNEWVRSTIKLVDDAMDALEAEAEEDEGSEPDEEDAAP
jgi:phage terminase Nu1 subunit (DNA packaging protein)